MIATGGRTRSRCISSDDKVLVALPVDSLVARLAGCTHRQPGINVGQNAVDDVRERDVVDHDGITSRQLELLARWEVVR